MHRILVALACLASLLGCTEPRVAAPITPEPALAPDAVSPEPADAAITEAEPSQPTAALEPAAAEQAPTPALDPARLTSVVHVGDLELVVLAVAPDQAWARAGAAVRRMDEESVVSAARDVELDALPAQLRELAASRWQLVGTHGDTCLAELAPPVLIRRAEGLWADDGEAADDMPPIDDADIRAMWPMSEDVLAAVARPVSGTCDGSYFAHAEGHAPARVLLPVEGEPDADPRAMQAFLALPAQQALAAEYASYRATDPEAESPEWVMPETWLEYASDEGALVRVLRDTTGRELTLVGGDASGCGAFTGSLFALLEGDRVIYEGDFDTVPAIAVDLDGDGALTLVAWERVGVSIDGGLRTEWLDARAGYFGCSC